jgi:hypothetical protein
VETRLVVEEIKDMQSLKDTCRVAFEGAQTNPSATQQRVSETMRHMGLLVEDEVRCPKSGYSIDMIVHDSTLEIGGKRSIRVHAGSRQGFCVGVSTWLGPSYFFISLVLGPLNSLLGYVPS